ncbi:MAG: hypothetical protein ACPIOQ_63150 [Promethearchaeia archaeon]
MRGRDGEGSGGGSSLLRWERLRSGTRRGREPLFTPVVLQAEAAQCVPRAPGGRPRAEGRRVAGRALSARSHCRSMALCREPRAGKGESDLRVGAA